MKKDNVKYLIAIVGKHSYDENQFDEDFNLPDNISFDDSETIIEYVKEVYENWNNSAIEEDQREIVSISLKTIVTTYKSILTWKA